MKIEYGFHGADLFPEDDFDYNVPKSAALYADLVQQALKREYPDAEIVVTYDLDATGVLPYNLRTFVDDETAEYATGETLEDIERVDKLASDVYYDFEWVVKERNPWSMPRTQRGNGW